MGIKTTHMVLKLYTWTKTTHMGSSKQDTWTKTTHMGSSKQDT